MTPFDIAAVRLQLPGRRIEWFESIDSTMYAASRLAAEGAPSGTAVVAGSQTAGYGRQGREWYSEAGAGLYVSVVLRFSLPPESLPVATLALGLAVAAAISKTAGVLCDLRWPNDVLIRGRKCAGILPQLEGPALVAGIGANVNHQRFPPALAPLATSLRLESGEVQSREDLLVELLRSIDSLCGMLAGEGKDPILDMFAHASSYVQGRRVRVEQPGPLLEGTTAGLNSSGFLLLDDDAGRRHTLMTGGIRPANLSGEN